jgi:hypothetical protein
MEAAGGTKGDSNLPSHLTTYTPYSPYRYVLGVLKFIGGLLANQVTCTSIGLARIPNA